jgi:hypothetical protein
MTGRLLPTSRQPGNPSYRLTETGCHRAYLPRSLPPIFPSTAPPVPAAKLPAFVAVRFRLRLKFPAPPACTIQPATVGTVKYPIILMVGDVSDIYVTNFGKMMNDGNFSPRELDAIAFGYTRLLEESNGVLQDLRQVINVSTLSMTDKDRMDVVDRCYYEMRRYRNLVSYYTNKNIAVSYLRARKKNDLDRVMRLYGNEISKYW